MNVVLLLNVKNTLSGLWFCQTSGGRYVSAVCCEVSATLLVTTQQDRSWSHAYGCPVFIPPFHRL